MASITQTARRIGRRGLVVLSVTATMAISGVAFASWTLTGGGDGAATATNVVGLTASVSSGDNLYPGLTTNAELTVTNTNEFPVTITAVNFDPDVDVVVTNAGAGCTATDSEVDFTTVSGLSLVVAAGTTDFVVPGGLTNAVAMGATSNNDCQGGTFTKPFTLTANIG